MQITINGKIFSTNAKDINELKAEFLQQDSKISNFIKANDLMQADIFILNGFAIKENITLNHNDKITIIKRGVMPKYEILKDMIEARNSPELNLALQNATIGIAGAGGLGSNIAISLARVGVARIVIADFDIVEPSNLNRQQYFIRHIGMKKVDAIRELISDANPFVKVITHDVFLNEQNVAEIFKECSIICEAFDNTIGKTMFLNEAGKSLSNKQIITASGMAGYYSSNSIKTMNFAHNVYVCGDLKSEAKIGQGLMAPRVAICANHQANLALRLLMGNKE